MIGAVYRVIAFNVLPCPWFANSAPEITYSQNISSSLNFNWSADTLIFENDEISIPLMVTDPDPTAEIQIVASSSTLSLTELNVVQNSDSLYSFMDTLYGSLNLNVLNNNLGIHKIQVVAINDQCDNVKSDSVEFWIDVKSTISLKEEKFRQWEVFPIPANDILFLRKIQSGYGSDKFILRDVHGKIHQNGIINSNDFQLNLSSLPSGLYFLDLIGTTNERHKIILQR